jgi:hypothetical protein
MDPRLFDRSEVCASLLRRSLRRIIYANHGSDLFVCQSVRNRFTNLVGKLWRPLSWTASVMLGFH